MPDISELKFIRVIDPSVFNILVGSCRQLFRNIEDMDDEKIDVLCKFSSSILTTTVIENGRLLRIPNPLVHIVALVDDDNKFRGFLWAGIDIVEKHIFVHAFSLDKKYQSSAQAASDAVIKYLTELPISEEYKQKILTATLRPKGYERCGWKRSKKVLMEYEVKKDVLEDTKNNTTDARASERPVPSMASAEST